MIFDVLALFRTILDLCLHLGRQSSRKLLQPMLTAACVTGVYTAVHVSQEGGVMPGLRVAFLDNDQSRARRQRTEEETVLQAELRQFVTANGLIEQSLRTLLAPTSGASRVQLHVIHNGVTGLTGTGLLRYDVANSVASPGRVAGASLVNQPLSEWNDFLPQLATLDCPLVRVNTLHSAALQARLQSMGAAVLLVCPAADVQGKIVGAIFVMWDVNDPVPDKAEMRVVIDQVRRVGGQIAAILDLGVSRPQSLIAATD